MPRFRNNESVIKLDPNSMMHRPSVNDAPSLFAVDTLFLLYSAQEITRAAGLRGRDTFRQSVTGIGRLNVLTRNTAICARVIGSSGQYSGGSTEQPAVMPSADNCSIQAAAQWSAGTSSNTRPVAGEGAKEPGHDVASSRNIATCERETIIAGQ